MFRTRRTVKTQMTLLLVRGVCAVAMPFFPTFRGHFLGGRNNDRAGKPDVKIPKALSLRFKIVALESKRDAGKFAGEISTNSVNLVNTVPRKP